LHSGVRIVRVALLCAAVVAVGVVLVSGGSDGDPRTPAALPGLPPPFLGTAVTGDGGLTAAVDAYGDVVDVRAGPAGAALIDNPSDRQAAGTVPAKTGIVPRMTVGPDSPPLPMWRGTRVTQHYRAYSSVIETVAYVKEARLITLTAAAGDSLAMELIPRSSRQGRALPAISVEVGDGLHCTHAERAGLIDLLCRPDGTGPLPVVDPDASPMQQFRESRQLFGECDRVLREAGVEEHHWFARSTPLGGDAPAWARSMYLRSLMTIHALTSRATGAVAAGARDGWAYVWPRDAATAALALEASGHRAEARHVAKFLAGLDLGAAARFTESGAPVPGRAAQGDAAGWTTVAANATGAPPPPRLPWRDRADYQESTPGTYLANAIAATATRVDGPKTGHIGGFSAHRHRAVAEARRIAREFGTEDGLVREAGVPESGLDSAAGWAVRPFGLRPLYGEAEETLLHLLHDGTPFGITPGEGWKGGNDPWSAPTAWSAWALAALDTPRSHRAARALLADLRRASTPAGDLPERVGAHTGIPTSTTPLLWSSAFTVLALRELWP
jgi:glucoamylase